jgi:hypothetical protein
MTDDTILTCPDCGDGRLRVRCPDAVSSAADSPERYACRNCGALVADPNRRERRGDGSLTGLAARLDAADADAVGRSP